VPSILEQLPYPWADPLAQQLHLTLTTLHPTPQRAVMVAERAGIAVMFLDAQQAPIFVWHDILDLAAQGGLTRQLAVTVRDLLNAESPQRGFFDDLLADRATAIDAEPRNQDGTPIFIRDDDSVTEPEALLFRDDLTLETGRLPALIQTMQTLVTLAPAVCRIEAGFGPRGTGVGTGFRIDDDLVLTNWHVLHDAHGDGSPASSVTLEFGYEDDGHGATAASTAVAGDVATIITDKSNDWAVIRPSTSLGNEFRIVKLSEAGEPVRGESAYIIQHPGGRRKRLGYVRNHVSDFDDRVVHYLTDTEQGSSGSPVFDAAGRLIGLHHAGGTPQTVTGRPPMTKNEGIRIAQVVQGLQQHGIGTP
jgi:V8-like Glu-specific endopeptidase